MVEHATPVAPAPAREPATVAAAPAAESAAPTYSTRGLLRLQRLAGNRAVTSVLQRNGPPPTQQELDDVTELMPIMPDIDALVTSTETECVRWNTWRGTMQGDIPGNGAFVAMEQFKTAVRAKDFDAFDERIQKICRRRLTGDNRQLLTEMYAFSLGANTTKGGDASGLAKVFGIQSKALTHKYKLKIAYSAGPKGKIGVGVGYTYRSAGIFYTNDFGMAYNKPLNMRSFMASFGPGAGASLGQFGFSGEGSDSSLIFWKPDDFETDFTVTKVGAAAAAGVKGEVKLLELIRVTSDKHPPLLFNMTNVGDTEVGGEVGAEIGGGVEVEKGKMVGGDDVGKVTVTTPTLEEARKNAEQAKLIPPQDQAPQWLVINTTIVPFPTGKSDANQGEAATRVQGAAKIMEAWMKENPGGEMRVEVVGQASPRWRHPKKGQIPDDLNQKLSEERAKNTKGSLRGALWSFEPEVNANGTPGPTLDLDDDRAKATGGGTLKAKAELADPDNDDAAYRVAVITVWAKKPAPAPAAAP